MRIGRRTRGGLAALAAVGLAVGLTSCTRGCAGGGGGGLAGGVNWQGYVPSDSNGIMMVSLREVRATPGLKSAYERLEKDLARDLKPLTEDQARQIAQQADSVVAVLGELTLEGAPSLFIASSPWDKAALAGWFKVAAKEEDGQTVYAPAAGSGTKNSLWMPEDRLLFVGPNQAISRLVAAKRSGKTGFAGTALDGVEARVPDGAVVTILSHGSLGQVLLPAPVGLTPKQSVTALVPAGDLVKHHAILVFNSDEDARKAEEAAKPVIGDEAKISRRGAVITVLTEKKSSDVGDLME
jgi:hypothetical protein